MSPTAYSSNARCVIRDKKGCLSTIATSRVNTKDTGYERLQRAARTPDSGREGLSFNGTVMCQQLREERRAAKAAAAASAKNVLRKETEWMRRQPKARSVKAAARVRQFYELTAAARDVPQAETHVAFDGGVGMRRQVRTCAQRPLLLLLAFAALVYVWTSCC